MSVKWPPIRRWFGTPPPPAPTVAPVQRPPAPRPRPAPSKPPKADDDPTPYFSPVLCGVDGVPLTIHVRQMLTSRSDAQQILATIASDTLPVVESSTTRLMIRPDQLGPRAKLITRPLQAAAPSRWKVLPMAVHSAPVSAAGAGPAVTVLPFGDSIIGLEGAQIMKAYLIAWGYRPTMIGTMIDGPERCEGRSGWASGDYTNAITDRAIILPPGEEDSYLALPNKLRRDRNVFGRVATESDEAALVRNGHIFDPAFYQQRFGLPTPDVVIDNLGGNDIRDRGASEVHGIVLENDLIRMRQFRASWPDALILRMLPGTAHTTGRDARWSTRYIPTIRAMMDTVRIMADPRIVLVPAWALSTAEAGYRFAPDSPDPTTGVITTTVADEQHLEGPARQQLWRAVAGYVACGACRLI